MERARAVADCLPVGGCALWDGGRVPGAAATWWTRLGGLGHMRRFAGGDPSSGEDGHGVGSAVGEAAGACYHIWRRRARRRPSASCISIVYGRKVL